MNQLGRWMVTPRGRNICLAFITAPYFVGGLYHTYVNLFDHQNFITSIYELKDKNGEPVRLAKPVRRLIKKELEIYEENFVSRDETLTRIGTKPKEYNFYASNDLEFHFVGRAPHFLGCSLALPYYLSFSRPEDIKDEFLFARTSKNYSLWHLFQNPIPLKIDWSSQLGAEFRDSLILSLDAKQYAIRRWIHEANSSLAVLRCANYFVPAGILAMTFSMFDNFIRIFKLFKPSIQVPVFVLLTFSGPLLTRTMKDYVDVTMSRDMDKEILSGEDWEKYKRGGVEFFEKSLQRNKCLREILEKRGEKLYSIDGNVLKSQSKLTDRLRHIKKYVNDKFNESQKENATISS